MRRDTEGLVIITPLSERDKLSEIWSFAKEKIDANDTELIGSINKLYNHDLGKLFIMADYNRCDDELFDIYEYAKNHLSDESVIMIIQGYET